VSFLPLLPSISALSKPASPSKTSPLSTIPAPLILSLELPPGQASFPVYVQTSKQISEPPRSPFVLLPSSYGCEDAACLHRRHLSRVSLPEEEMEHLQAPLLQIR